jgi:uncharacterized protein YgiM (DUF1202 family)
MLRLTVILLVPILAVAWSVHSQESLLPQDVVEAYERAYQNGETLGAFQHYNAGQAYKAQRQVGKAMARLLYAWELAPRDLRIARAVNDLYSTIGYKAQEQSLLFAFVEGLQSILSFAEQSVLSFTIWCVCVAVLAMPQRKIAYVKRLALACALLAFALLALRDYVENTHPRYVVIAPQALVYTGAGETYLALFELPEATPLRVLAKRDEWSLVQVSNAQQGWLLSQQIFPVRP